MKELLNIFRIIALVLSLSAFITAHPLNTTNLELELDKKEPLLSLRFYTSNLENLLFLKETPRAKQIENNKIKILNYIKEHIKISNNNQTCRLKLKQMIIEKDIALRSTFFINCKQAIEILKINYRLFFDFDKTQEGVMQVVLKDDERLFVFSPHQKTYTLKLTTPKAFNISDFTNFIYEGIWHIWEGIDHILFLLMLLLPTTLYSRNFKSAFTDILKIVTAFTLSHSFTLFLSMLDILKPPQQLIETLIALSVVLTAINNIYPILPKKKTWLLAFTFGFIHGFGFANAMEQLNIERANFASALFGFNIGVEIGQIVIVAATLPLLYLLAYKKVYGKIFVPLLSAIVAVIALLWAVQRAFSLHLMPF